MDEFRNLSLGERLKYIRKDLKMTQDEFGSSLGVSRDVINNMERNRVKNTNEAILLLICKTHRVNYFFLTEGKGDPYIGLPDIIMDDVIQEYKLDQLDRDIIEEYVKLDVDTRNAIKSYLKKLFEKAPD